MSETVHVKGKLLRLFSDKITAEEGGRILFELIGGASLDREDCYKDWLEEEFYKKIHIQGDRIYVVSQEQYIDNNDDIAVATGDTDGIIDFELRYYNGGASFSEVLDEALTKKEKLDSENGR